MGVAKGNMPIGHIETMIRLLLRGLVVSIRLEILRKLGQELPLRLGSVAARTAQWADK